MARKLGTLKFYNTMPGSIYVKKEIRTDIGTKLMSLFIYTTLFEL